MACQLSPATHTVYTCIYAHSKLYIKLQYCNAFACSEWLRFRQLQCKCTSISVIRQYAGANRAGWLARCHERDRNHRASETAETREQRLARERGRRRQHLAPETAESHTCRNVRCRTGHGVQHDCQWTSTAVGSRWPLLADYPLHLAYVHSLKPAYRTQSRHVHVLVYCVFVHACMFEQESTSCK